MPQVVRSDAYNDWFGAVRDLKAKARIAVRIESLIAGNPGDVRPVGEGVSELRLDFGPGCRIYFAMRGRDLIVLLGGGDKATQARDITLAKPCGAPGKENEE